MLCFIIRKVFLTFFEDILSCFCPLFVYWQALGLVMPGIGAFDSPALGIGCSEQGHPMPGTEVSVRVIRRHDGNEG